MPEIVVRGRGDFRSLQRDLARAGGLITAGLGAAVLKIGADSVGVEKAFSQNMNLVAAATDAPAKKIQALSDLAVDLGAKTAFSANDAAEAMLELAKAGLTPATIQAGALEGTLTLAAAGGTDLATAATVASNALNTFSLKGKDMASVAAAMAGGANASSASIESLALGLSQVGAGAVNAGLSLQETVGVLSAFDAAGVKGSDAGTSLKTMLARLVPQTRRASEAMKEVGLDFTNADGSFVSITEVADRLQKRLGGLSDEQRTTALATIFGSDATRAATILMRQGEGGIRKYIRATRDQNAAEDMAAARMKGTAGALERLSGAVETAELRIGQELAPAVAAGANVLSENLVPATEAGIDGLKDLWAAFDDNGIDGVTRQVEEWTGAQGKLEPIVDEVVDALEGMWRIVEDLAPAFADAAAELPPFLSPLKLVGDTLNLVADVLEVVPDEMKTLAIEAGIAALVLPRLTGAVTSVTTAVGFNIARLRQFQAELSYTTTRTQALAGAMTRAGGAARTAAGIGGMLALTQGMQEANRTTGTLFTTLGGAATGFAVGGPWGALIGGGAGLAMGIFADRTDDAAEAMRGAAPPAADYASSLDDLTGATTRATKALIFDQLTRSGAISQARAFGISSRDVVNAVLGEEAAFARVNKALEAGSQFTIAYRDANGTLSFQSVDTQKQVREVTRAIEEQGGTLDSVAKKQIDVAAKQGLLAFIGRETDAWRASARAQREKILSLQDFDDLAGRIPKRIVSELDVTGVVPTLAGLARVANRYKGLDNKQLKAIVEAVGVDATVKEIRRVAEQLKETDRARPDLSGYTADFNRNLDRTVNDARRLGEQIGEKLRTGTKDSKADLDGFKRSVKAGVDAGEITARQGAAAIGSALKYGLPAGFAGADGLWSASVRSAVSAAIQAGRAQAGVHSPSKETAYIGEMMTKGLVNALARGWGKTKKGGRDLVGAALAGVTEGSSGVDRALERLTALIEKRVNLKDAKAERAREKAILAGLRDEYAALRKIGKLHDENERKLERWNGILKQRKQEFNDYVSAVRSSFQQYGNIVGLGQNDDGSVGITSLLDQLRDRVANAQRFADLIRGLRDEDGPKLTAAALQQLVDAGPEAALATAEALAAGGDAAVSEINKLTAQIAAAGGGLGEALAGQFFQGGIDAAEAMVAGLEKRQRRLDRMADRFADRIADALNKALGGKGGPKDSRDERVAARSSLSVADTYASTRSREIRLRISADQVSKLQQGKDIIAVIDYARQNGVRSTTIP